MMTLLLRRILTLCSLALLLLAGATSPLPGPTRADGSRRPDETSVARVTGKARRFALRGDLRFEGSRLPGSGAAEPLALHRACAARQSRGIRDRDPGHAACDSHEERFRAALAVDIQRVLGPRLASPGWRLDYHRIAAQRRSYVQVELRCDLDADGDVTPADARAGGDILAGRVTPSGMQALQLDVAPVAAPNGWLDDADLAVVERAVAGETPLCEVPVTRVRRLRDRDGDGVLRIACLGDSNSCIGDPFACGPVQSLCSLLQELSPRIATLDGEVLPAEFVSYAWAGTTVCENPKSRGHLGARPQYTVSRDRVDPGPADAAVIAFGTNDYGVLRKSPAEIARCYRELVNEADRDGIPVWVGFTPPVAAWTSFKPEYLAALALRNRHAEETNQLLRRTFPVHLLVDFSSNFGDLELFLDNDPLHFNNVGQRMRAERVLDAVH